MPDLPIYYQPDCGIACRTGRKPDPMTNVDKPVSMKVRMAMPKTRPNTKAKHYKRKSKSPYGNEPKRVFY